MLNNNNDNHSNSNTLYGQNKLAFLEGQNYNLRGVDARKTGYFTKTVRRWRSES